MTAWSLPSTRAGRLAEAPARHELLFSALMLACASAMSDRVLTAVEAGWITAATNTFYVSAIVWGALWLAGSLVLDPGKEPVAYARRSDWIAIALALPAILAPFLLLNWMALTGLAIYVVFTSASRSRQQRGALIFLALSVPMFWSPRLASLASEVVLAVDAEFVSWILGTERVGNTVPFPGGSGYLYIAPGCSSIANVSLAILCWVAFGQFSNRGATLRDGVWLAAACAGVVAINVSRISLIGFFPSWYDFIHNSATGTMIASYATLAVILTICGFWKRREIFAPA